MPHIILFTNNSMKALARYAVIYATLFTNKVMNYFYNVHVFVVHTWFILIL